MARSVLIVRLGALGDLVHALPAVAALRDAWPESRIDWLVDARYRALLDFVPVVNRVIVIGSPGASLGGVVRSLRREHYDTAIDLQGLIKSAALARLSGAREVVGFATPLLREWAARLFYTTQADSDAGGHVIAKNVGLLRVLGVTPTSWTFPLTVPSSAVVNAVRGVLGIGQDDRFAVLNPGAGWPNKQWPPERFGRVARHLSEQEGWPSVVLWGPGEGRLAEAVVAASDGAAHVAPPTGLGDVLALARAAALVVGGDTGPLQLAAALGTPTVGIFGPTNPARNGPWSQADVTLSRFEQCECHHKRRCRRSQPCLQDIGVDEVIDAVDRRCHQVTFRG
ncbi:MAG: glycosyltransferase family 9 protein [Acidobacteria bacterium]|jgi:lipopolysaccharide heptosyltransferase I|nr:glycosyltransferase family 9 protein [Acidobacteriota bacterium]